MRQAGGGISDHLRPADGAPKRFSARFFVCELPSGQEPHFDDIETVDQAWVTPDDALARSAELALPPPQVRTMIELRTCASIEEVGHSMGYPKGMVTASIGVAEYRGPSAAAQASGDLKQDEDVLVTADRALYRAKALGRNQVATAVEGEGGGSTP